MFNSPVVIVGATGLVGTTLLSLLYEHAVPKEHIFLVASKNSAGKTLAYGYDQLVIHDLAEFDFKQSKIAFFCVGTELAAHYVPIATQAGNVVIDKSFHYRNHQDVPLIVPEVNAHAIVDYKNLNIIANPNCNVIPVAVALKPIYDAVGIDRINIATYQSVSGTGKDAISELSEQTRDLLDDKPINPKVYSQQIAFNVLPHIDDFQDNGYTKEEMKIVWEMRKIFGDDSIAINPTAVRVPVFTGHAAAVHIETKDKLTAKRAEEIIANAYGVTLINGDFPYPTPAHDAAGKDHVYVGRIREDISHNKGLNLWVVADNLRKGAALNALQIANHLIKHHL